MYLIAFFATELNAPPHCQCTRRFEHLSLLFTAWNVAKNMRHERKTAHMSSWFSPQHMPSNVEGQGQEW